MNTIKSMSSEQLNDLTINILKNLDALERSMFIGAMRGCAGGESRALLKVLPHLDPAPTYTVTGEWVFWYFLARDWGTEDEFEQVRAAFVDAGVEPLFERLAARVASALAAATAGAPETPSAHGETSSARLS